MIIIIPAEDWRNLGHVAAQLVGRCCRKAKHTRRHIHTYNYVDIYVYVYIYIYIYTHLSICEPARGRPPSRA